LTLLDYAILGILAIFAVTGFFRGLVSQLVSIIAIVAAFIVARTYYREAVLLLHFDFDYGAIAAFAVLFVAVFIVVKLLGLLVELLLKAAKLSFLNRIMGLLLGLLKGGLVCVIVVYLLFAFYPGGEDVVGRSPSGRYFLKAGREVIRLLPPDLREKVGSRSKRAFI